MATETIFETPVFRSYLFYSSILVIKMLFMSFFTGFTRVLRKAFVNPEDAVGLKVKPRVDEKVERIRRAHLNDLENIIPFFVAGFTYSLTNPTAAIASLLFLTFTVARLVHTFVYAVYVLPQPARGLSFVVGLLITAFMAIKSILYFA